MQKYKIEITFNYFHLDKLSIAELKKKHFMNKNMVALQKNHEKHMEKILNIT